jgi:hypothetical protein
MAAAELGCRQIQERIYLKYVGEAGKEENYQ